LAEEIKLVFGMEATLGIPYPIVVFGVFLKVDVLLLITLSQTWS